MSLTASMWTGVSGLRGHGQKMGVIGNNIANVSTVGFKGSRMHFEDFMSQSVSVANGVGQVGRGVTVGAVIGDFSQGSLETTNESTDVAITGNGFFTVKPSGVEMNYYTRAGNFRFDKDGFLVDPHGYRVQGWEIGREEVLPGAAIEGGAPRVNIIGVPGDIQLENFQSPPEQSGNVSMIVNLNSTAQSATGEGVQLFDQWDGTLDPPLGATQFIHQSTIRVYDENGGAHNLTTYFDAMDPNDLTPWLAAEGFPAGYRAYEFIVTVPPQEDMRPWGPGAGDPEQGKVMQGRVVFNAAGDMVAMRNVDNFIDPGQPTVPAVANPDFSQNGFPLMALNFLGSVDPVTGEPIAQLVELNFGLRNPTGDETDPWTQSAFSSTSFNSASSTLSQSQDGYTAGFLQNISVSREGVLTGRYSNGQVVDLFALTISDFNNAWGLRREGGNLFGESSESGPALTGIAGTGRLGTIASNALELSNVDLATEFVKMISTQKGFQANSKTITTTDMMLDEVIRMKR